jgi:hypothetical protein
MLSRQSLGFVGVSLLSLVAQGCVVEERPYRPYHREVIVEERPRETVVVEERPRTTTVVVEEEPGEVQCVEAPPPPRVEYVYETRPGYAWVHGYWVWRGRWVWVGGHWHACPPHRTLYVGGHWERRGTVHVWIGGYWR